MPKFDYFCDKRESHISEKFPEGITCVFEVEKPFSARERDEVCPICGAPAKRYFGRQKFVMKFNGLGFYTTDSDYKRQVKEANAIADHAYEKRADGAPKISEDPAFWQDLAENYDTAKWW